MSYNVLEHVWDFSPEVAMSEVWVSFIEYVKELTVAYGIRSAPEAPYVE
jgi:hypothetical protein